MSPALITRETRPFAASSMSSAAPDKVCASNTPSTMQSDFPVRKPFAEPLLQSQPFMLKSIALVLG